MPAPNFDVIASLAKRRGFVFLGTLEPRKNGALVLRAFERLWAAGSDAHLTVVGKAHAHGADEEAMLARLEDEPRLRVLGRAADARTHVTTLREEYPDAATPVILEGLVLRDLGDGDRALATALAWVASRPAGPLDAAFVPAMQGYLAED